MRRALSLASLLLVGAAAALDGEKRGDFPMPYTLDEAFHNSLAGIKSEGQVSPFIVGGEPAGPGQFPYTTLMYSRGTAFCTSSLIAAGWALGATHCLYFNNPIFNTGTVTIGTNEATIEPNPDRYEVPSYVQYEHPGYIWGPPTSLNDIALLELSAYSKYPPVRLQTPALSSLTAPGTPVIASGWGATQSGGNPSEFLRWAQLTVQPDSVCENLFPQYDAATNLCESADPKDTCQGDSGGPSVAMDPVTGWPYQVGITSYGGVCGAVAGAVYTRVSAFWDWIRNTSGLSLQYHDVRVSGGNGFIRAVDNTPGTGSDDPGYVTPASASKGPKVHFNKSVDSWGVSASLPAGTTLLSQVHAHGFDVALFGTFPSSYDRVLDSLHYTPEECKPAKNGRSIKCFDGTSTVTFSLRGSSGHAKVSIKAAGRDIKLGGATHLKAYLWLKNGDNYLVYSQRCKHSAGKMDC